MLVTMKEILNKAREGGYAVAAPNVFDHYTITACLQAAEEENSPIILDFGERDGDIFTFAKIAVPLARDCRVPVAINLDHGPSFESAMKAIRAGFTSVMADRSTLPFDENVRQVKEITDIAHISGVSVEAELGQLVERNQASNDDTLFLTDPQQAREFVDLTGVDCLAVAIGTAHGLYKGKPFLDYDRLEKIRKSIEVPLVLHGGSNTGDEALQKAVQSGISKVNLATDLFNAGMEAMKEHLASNPKANLVSANLAAAEGFKTALLRYMNLFLSRNKA
jgi:fructose-bisphosphate aldolase class II